MNHILTSLPLTIGGWLQNMAQHLFYDDTDNNRTNRVLHIQFSHCVV